MADGRIGSMCLASRASSPCCRHCGLATEGGWHCVSATGSQTKNGWVYMFGGPNSVCMCWCSPRVTISLRLLLLALSVVCPIVTPSHSPRVCLRATEALPLHALIYCASTLSRPVVRFVQPQDLAVSMKRSASSTRRCETSSTPWQSEAWQINENSHEGTLLIGRVCEGGLV